MSAISYADAKALLDLWIAADKAVTRGQSYEIAGRKLTRADASIITEKINFWRQECDRASAGGNGGNKVRGITPFSG